MNHHLSLPFSLLFLILQIPLPPFVFHKKAGAIGNCLSTKLIMPRMDRNCLSGDFMGRQQEHDFLRFSVGKERVADGC